MAESKSVEHGRQEGQGILRNDSIVTGNSMASSHEEHEPEEVEADLEKNDEHSAQADWEFERDQRLSRLASRTSSRPSLRERSLSRQQSMLNVLRARRTQTNGGADDLSRGFTHPMSHVKTSQDVLVNFDGPDDPYNALNWPFRKKLITTVLYGFTTMGTTFASAVFSTGQDQIAAEFHVGSEVATLGTALFLFGLGIGPLIWAPLSEVYGRKPAVLTPYFLSGIFAFACAVSKDIQTVCITRFFAGFFGAAPVTNTGGVLGDLWAPAVRANAIVGYAMAVVGGPTLGPIIGGAITSSSLGWRWTEYITGIYIMALLALDVLLLDECYPPMLLVLKARRLRHESGNWALHAKHEEWDVSIHELAQKYLVRPFQMLFTPICFLIALYASLVYGIVYAYLSGMPYIFQRIRGWGPVTGGLPFVALLVGILGGVPINLLNNKYYMRRLNANGGRAVPEARLPPMMFGGIMFTAGLFVFAWTSVPATIHWIAPIIGCVLMGAGFFTIFQAALNYLVDTFQRYGASAIAANTFLRSVLAGAFPLFITYMFDGIGVRWGLTIFGVFSALLIPVPFIFFTFGLRIRARGKWSRASV